MYYHISIFIYVFVTQKPLRGGSASIKIAAPALFWVLVFKCLNVRQIRV